MQRKKVAIVKIRAALIARLSQMIQQEIIAHLSLTFFSTYVNRQLARNHMDHMYVSHTEDLKLKNSQNSVQATVSII